MLLDGMLVDLENEAIVGGEGVDAVRCPVEDQGGGIGRGDVDDGIAGIGEESWGLDELGSEASDPAGGDIAALVGAGIKEHAIDFGTCIKDQGFFEEVAAFT